MTNLNLTVLEGCVTKDAELKKSKSGKSYCIFTIVVNRDHKVGEEFVEGASFFNLSLWGNRAEKTSPFLKKGMRLAIEGYLEQSRWDDNGEKKSRIDVRIERLHFLSKVNKIPAPSAGNASNVQEETAPASFNEYEFSEEGESYDGDIF